MTKKKQAAKERVVRFRIDAETYRLLVIRAMHFFDGNVSEMLRETIRNFRNLKHDPTEKKQRP